MSSSSMWEHLLNTPGASSDDPIFNKHTKPEKRVKTVKLEAEPEVEPAQEPSPMEKLAKTLSNHFAGEESRNIYSLNQPMSLTTWGSEKGYSKTPHIGGEDFWKLDFYVGKKGTIIVKMQPKQVASYTHIEVDLEKSFSMFNYLETDLGVPLGRSIKRELDAIKRGETLEKEVVEVVNRADQYDGGFGSW
jgi:hypothetical protein